MKKEKKVFDHFQKSQKKLTVTGWSPNVETNNYVNVWFWREGEKSFKEFKLLQKTEKNEYLNVLVNLGEKYRSTNDEYILKYYGPNKIGESINYFSIIEDLDEQQLIPTETTAEVGETIPQPIPTIVELTQIGEEYVKEYLDEFFKFQNSRWKDDLKFTRTVQQFIENTKSYMIVDDITEAHIITYKKLTTK